MRVERVLYKIALAALAAGVVKFAEVYASYRAKAAAKSAGKDRVAKVLADLEERIDRTQEAVAQLQQIAVIEQARRAQERKEEPEEGAEAPRGEVRKRKG